MTKQKQEKVEVVTIIGPQPNIEVSRPINPTINILLDENCEAVVSEEIAVWLVNMQPDKFKRKGGQ